jgi:hypothetical protein
MPELIVDRKKKEPDLIAFRQPDHSLRESYRRAAVRKGIPLSAWIRSTLDRAVARANPRGPERRVVARRAA